MRWISPEVAKEAASSLSNLYVSKLEIGFISIGMHVASACLYLKLGAGGFVI